ncbi:hypothetical protein [Lactiplantibacillus plantarum]
MLQELSITNFAIIEHLDIAFKEGLQCYKNYQLRTLQLSNT